MSENKPEHDLVEQLSVLGDLEPSTQARLNYRRAVASGLSPAATATRPWWKRSISIPVPIAIAASIFALGGIGMQFRNTKPDVATSTSIESLDPAPPMGAPAGLAIGEEHFFQAIYRDSISLGCGTGQNSSQGIRVRVTP